MYRGVDPSISLFIILSPFFLSASLFLSLCFFFLKGSFFLIESSSLKRGFLRLASDPLLHTSRLSLLLYTKRTKGTRSSRSFHSHSICFNCPVSCSSSPFCARENHYLFYLTLSVEPLSSPQPSLPLCLPPSTSIFVSDAQNLLESQSSPPPLSFSSFLPPSLIESPWLEALPEDVESRLDWGRHSCQFYSSACFMFVKEIVKFHLLNEGRRWETR